MIVFHSALDLLKRRILAKAGKFARSYLESGRFMSRYFSGHLLRNNGPQRLLLPEQFNAQEIREFDYVPMWGRTGSGEFSIEKGFWKDIDKACTSSLAGYVPYVKGNTMVGIHHFWSVNYGLRKQLLGHIVLIKGGAFAASCRFTLPAYQFAVIDLNDFFESEEGDAVYVEVYHPRIPNGHGGHNGQLRYWGIYGDYSSTVHSLPVQKITFRQAVVRSCRGTFPDEHLVPRLAKSFCYWGGERRVLPSALTHLAEATPLGFYLIGRESPASVWHSAAYTAEHARPGARFQAVAFPPVPSVDAVMSFMEAIGSTGKVSFLLYSESRLIGQASRSIGPEEQLVASQVFPDADLSGRVLIVDLSEHGHCIHSGYVNLIYQIQDQICDCVHSHWLRASRLTGVRKDSALVKSDAGQSLKFMHFPATDAYQAWLAVWTMDEPIPVKLRFLTSKGKEYVSNIDIPPVGVFYLNVSVLFLQHACQPCDHVVLQLESGVANLDANLYTYSLAAKSLSVDHFTGG